MLLCPEIAHALHLSRACWVPGTVLIALHVSAHLCHYPILQLRVIEAQSHLTTGLYLALITFYYWYAWLPHQLVLQRRGQCLVLLCTFGAQQVPGRTEPHCCVGEHWAGRRVPPPSAHLGKAQ